MRALYHDDAIDEHGKFAKGPASEFLNKLPEIQAPMAVLHHNVTTINLKLDGVRADVRVQRASGILFANCLGSLPRSEEHTSELQSLMRISYAVFCLKKKTTTHNTEGRGCEYQ